MARSRLPAALERDQDDSVLRREWRFERAGWVALGLALIAGLAGAFGNGALASASVVSMNGAVELRYERLIRHGAQSEIEVRLAPTAIAADSVVVLALDQEYLAMMDVERITPEPLRVRASGGRVNYHLLRLDPSGSMVVRFAVQPRAMGLRRASLGTAHELLEFRQFVLP